MNILLLSLKLIQLKEARIKLRQTEDNYHQMTEDFNEVQKQLMSSTKREADTQESLMIMVMHDYKTDFTILKIFMLNYLSQNCAYLVQEKNYRSKIEEVENEAVRLRNLVDKLSEELKEIKKTLASKDIELCQAQNKCKNCTDHLDTVRQDVCLYII